MAFHYEAKQHIFHIAQVQTYIYAIRCEYDWFGNCLIISSDTHSNVIGILFQWDSNNNNNNDDRNSSSNSRNNINDKIECARGAVCLWPPAWRNETIIQVSLAMCGVLPDCWEATKAHKDNMPRYNKYRDIGLQYYIVIYMAVNSGDVKPKSIWNNIYGEGCCPGHQWHRNFQCWASGDGAHVMATWYTKYGFTYHQALISVHTEYGKFIGARFVFRRIMHACQHYVYWVLSKSLLPSTW